MSKPHDYLKNDEQLIAIESRPTRLQWSRHLTRPIESKRSSNQSTDPKPTGGCSRKGFVEVKTSGESKTSILSSTPRNA
jgi:hypothetical protein